VVDKTVSGREPKYVIRGRGVVWVCVRPAGSKSICEDDRSCGEIVDEMDHVLAGGDLTLYL